jgi:hypothetical protein
MDNQSVAQWIKLVRNYSDFATAGLTNDIEIYSLPAGWAISRELIKHSTSFSGGTIATYTISLGIVGNLTKYSTPFNVLSAPSDTNFQPYGAAAVENWGSATSIRAAAISTVGNLDAATQGVVEVYLLISKVKI